MEKIVDRHIRDAILKDRPLHKLQFAYQTGKSSELALLHLVGRIEKVIEDGEVAVGIFIDIEGAFDSTPIEVIERAVVGRGLNETLTKWISALLRERVLTGALAGAKRRIMLSAGCPQGGVISPLLWCLVVDELIKKMNEQGFYTQGYADDLAVLISGKHQMTISDLTRTALNTIQGWCNANGLRINPHKITLVPFTKRRKLDGLRAPSLDGTQLSLSGTVKHLGVTLDRKLLWDVHIRNICDKSRRVTWMCNRAIGTSWGLKPNIAHWMYTTVIRPAITYAAVAWWQGACTSRAKTLMEKAQRLACLMITGAMRTTPTAAMEVLLYLPPLHIEIKHKAISSAYRLKNLGFGPRPLGSYGTILGILEEDDILSMPSDLQINTHCFLKRFTIYIPGRGEALGRSGHSNGGIVCYTDGSKTMDGTGAGVWRRNGIPQGMSFSLGAHTTVFQAEVFAIIACVDGLLKANTQGQRIKILSDSQAAIRAIDSPCAKSKLVEECRGLLNTLGGGNGVRLEWVPGHMGVAGNEKADELARKGSETRPLAPEPLCGVSTAKAKGRIKMMCLQEHRRSWHGVRKQTQSKAFLSGPDRKRTMELLGLSRWETKLVVSLYTGHGMFNKHMHSLGISRTSLCRFCGMHSETALHLVGQCDALARSRLRVFGEPYVDAPRAWDITPRSLREFARRCKLLYGKPS